MSIKTLRKRIALVAVSALGVGLLSVAPASAADLSANVLQVADATAVSGYNTANNMCDDTTASNVDSAVIPLTGKLSIGAGTSDGSGMTARAEVSGPGVIESERTGSVWTIVSSTVATASDLGTNATNNILTVKPTGLGTIKITLRATTAATSSAVDVVTITVASSCVNGVYSSAASYFAVTSATNAVSGVSFATNADDDAALVASGGNGYIRMALNDAYGENLSVAGAVVATVTGANCEVSINDVQSATSSYTAGSSSTAVDADTAVDEVILVTQDDGDVPAKCTASVSFNGVTVGTKTFTFQGIPSKVTVSDVTVGRNGDYGYYRVTVADSAGNLLPSVAISYSSTNADNVAASTSGVVSNPQSNSGAATSATAGSGYGKTQAVTAANVTAATSGAAGLTRYTCGSVGGTAKIVVRAVVSAATATYVSSDPFTVACGGALATWSISMDKASYAPGEIATLTLSGKDSDGRPVSTFTLLSGVEYAFGGMTAVTAPTNNDAFSSGIGTKTYQFSVGTSEGAFVGSFKTTGSVDTAAKTVQYKVAATTAAVTNAEVLAAIVKLIASINKQIRALQKQLRR
jgi:hypothetical protein